MKVGKIEVNSENLMPIIKKWLYSDRDIFLRELISNATDAISKHKKLVSIGEAQETAQPYRIIIKTDKKKNTITISDNGIGMTADEVEKYITKVAYSGASEFISKYSKTNGDGIIGHFGLGFYSAFMVSESVELDTLSYINNSEAALWTSDGGEEYTLDKGKRATQGTTITLKLNKSEKEFSEELKIRELLNKYCAFMPYDIYLNPNDNLDVKTDNKTENSDNNTDNTDIDSDNNSDNTSGKIEVELCNKPVNNTLPLYLKEPKECTDSEYEDFYKRTFNDYDKPLFWVHLNVDYPFKMKGILYFPKQKNIMEIANGEVKLYCNQVFIANNIKEVIPEFLMLLKGVIDIPDIPLNVSRSFLQNDKEVLKISKHITKKVADRLTNLFNNDKDKLISAWTDISPFIKYGCIKNEEFYEKIKDIILYETINSEHITLKQFNDNKGDAYYVSDTNAQAQYIKMYKEKQLNALILNHYIDSHFINFIEYKNNEVKFKRIDSELPAELKTDTTDVDAEKLIELFKSNVELNDTEVKATALIDNSIPAILTLTEESRRMQEMAKQYGSMFGSLKEQYVLELNTNNTVIKSLLNKEENELKRLCKYIFMLSLLSNRAFTAEELNEFLSLSYDFINIKVD